MSDVGPEDLVLSETDVVLNFMLPTVWSSSGLHADLSTHNPLPIFPTLLPSQTDTLQ